MKEKGSRIDRLLTAINQGKTADEAYGSIGEPGHELRTGYASEQYVRGILKTLPIVDQARLTPRGEKQDKQGIDIAVLLKEVENQTPLAVNRVNVQVKSSRSGITTFRRKMIERYNLKEEELDEWLKKERLIILNGTKPQQAIKEEFMRQLQGITQYHTQPKVE